MTQVELEKGTKVPLSLGKILYYIGTGAFGMLACGLVMVISAVLMWQDIRDFKTVGSYFLFLVGFGILSVWLPFACQPLLRGEYYVIGRRALQKVTRSGRIVHHIPYDHFEDVDITEIDGGEGKPPVQVVVINLSNGRSPEVILGGQSQGTSYRVDPSIDLEAMEFRRKLCNRVERWEEEQSDDPIAKMGREARAAAGQRPEKPRPLAQKSGNPALIPALGMAALTGVLLLLGVALAVWPTPRPGEGQEQPQANQPPREPPPSLEELLQGGKSAKLGPINYLAEMPEYAVKAGPWPLGKKGTGLNGDWGISVKSVGSPNGLGTHPPANGYAAARYRLDGQVEWFKAAVALNDSCVRALSPATFEVLGDGKSLWKSKPVAQMKTKEECDVPLTGVEVLELRVHPQGDHLNVHAVWLDPRVERAKE
jgi:hypothetical protein